VDHGEEGWIVHVGCRRLDVEQAHAHWAKHHDREHAAECLAALDYLLTLALRRWTPDDRS